jgi:hypothetical protein
MNRRDMLRAGFRDLARTLPLALGAAGGLGRLLNRVAATARPPRAASFPRGNMAAANQSGVLPKEED